MIRDMWAITEKLPWTAPIGYKISLYFESEWFISGFGDLGGVPMYLPTQNANKAYLLRFESIIECVVPERNEV